jgi:hypothetical protein
MWLGYVYMGIVRGRQEFTMVWIAFIKGCNKTNGKWCGAWKSAGERKCKAKEKGTTHLLMTVSRERWGAAC